MTENPPTAINTMKVKIKIEERHTILPSKTRIGVLYKKHSDFYLRIKAVTLYTEGITFVRFKDSTDPPTLVWLYDSNSMDALIEVGEPTLSV